MELLWSKELIVHHRVDTIVCDGRGVYPLAVTLFYGYKDVVDKFLFVIPVPGYGDYGVIVVQIKDIVH